MKIYFAGPLFTPYERSFIDECAATLRADGFDVFVPHEHELAVSDELTAEHVFRVDYDGVKGANAILALLDGPMIDDGTACEIGLFYEMLQNDPSKKGIVGLVTDIRVVRTEYGGEEASRGLNLFVLGCIEAAGEVCTTFDDAHRALQRLRDS